MATTNNISGNTNMEQNKFSDSNTQRAPGYEGAHADPSSASAGGEQRHKGMGEKIKEKIGMDPKDPARDPKDQAWAREHGNNSQQSGSTFNNNNNQGGSFHERGLERQGEREHLQTGSSNSNTRTDRFEHREAAPVTAEHVHDEYTHVDKTREAELRDRTEVQQTVQPIQDERTEGVQRDRVDHGIEVHEHGHGGLDERARAELAAKREKLEAETRSTHDSRTNEMSARNDVDVREKQNRIEEVVPVVEKDIYRPHEIEHNKRVVDIHHERPVVQEQRENAPISMREWESRGNGGISTSSSNTTSSNTRDFESRGAGVGGATTGGAVGNRERAGSSSSSSSSSDEGEGVGATGGAAGGATKVKKNRTHRKKGLKEKVKELVGLDPKDGKDPKDAAYNQQQTGITGSSGFGANVGSSETTGGAGAYSLDNNAGTNVAGHDQRSNTGRNY